MQFFKTVIVEDNADNAAVLRRIIKDNHPDIVIFGEANSVSTALDLLLQAKPDIVLMDIELAPGTAFDVLLNFYNNQAIDFEIIFISAHQRYDYVTRAIDFSCLAYLTKPIDPELLRGAIEKAKAKQTKKIQIEQLFHRLQDLGEHDNALIIPTKNNNKIAVRVADIAYFRADGQITIVHLYDQTEIVAFRILGHFKKMLAGDSPFFLVHNSYFVNVRHVKDFNYAQLDITLKNGEKIKASRRSGKAFKQYWDEYTEATPNVWQKIRQIFQ